MIGFSVEIEEKENYPILYVKGEIDIYTCPALQEKIKEIIDTGQSQLILDLDDLQYIDSTGLGTIAHTAQSIKEKNGQVHVICNKPQIKKIFKVSGLEKRNITIYDTQTAVLEHLA
jgi:anti-sigma B factor antagonist